MGIEIHSRESNVDLAQPDAEARDPFLDTLHLDPNAIRSAAEVGHQERRDLIVHLVPS